MSDNETQDYTYNMSSLLLFCGSNFHRCIPESPRWLIAHDRLDEAQAIIERFGGKRKKPVNSELLRILLDNVRKIQLQREREAKKYTPIDLFRTPKLRKWTALICYQWYELFTYMARRKVGRPRLIIELKRLFLQ